MSDAKNDPFVKFHVKQGLALIISYAVVGILSFILNSVFGAIGFLFFFSFAFPFLYLGLFIIDIIGIVNVLNNKVKELPLIGSFANIFTF